MMAQAGVFVDLECNSNGGKIEAQAGSGLVHAVCCLSYLRQLILEEGSSKVCQPPWPSIEWMWKMRRCVASKSLE